MYITVLLTEFYLKRIAGLSLNFDITGTTSEIIILIYDIADSQIPKCV